MKESGRHPSTAAGVMSPVISVDAGTSVENAMHQMREADISYVLVQPADGGEWGIMTKRDVVTKIVGGDQSTTKVNVDTIASRPLLTVPADANLRTVSSIMSQHNIRRVVVEAKNVPVGVVSDTDLFEIVEEFGWGLEE
jgi:isocitrate dehydrogenase